MRGGDAIAHGGDLKVVAIAGPSSSGKTTLLGALAAHVPATELPACESLKDTLAKNKLTVVMFIATQCPVSNAYNARMAQLVPRLAGHVDVEVPGHLGMLVGVARHQLGGADRGRVADVAVTVVDDWHGRGVATALLVGVACPPDTQTAWLEGARPIDPMTDA